MQEELAPDDGDELFNGKRKGKSDLRDLDHIVGVSDMLGRQKAKEKIAKSVTFNKTKMLQFSLKVLSQHIKKKIVDHLRTKEEDVCFDIGGFGKIYMFNDADADYDSLYPKKLVHEPTGNLASVIKSVTFNKSKAVLTRSLDYNNLSQMSGMSPTVLKNDLDALANHLIQLIVGNTADSN